MTTPANSEKLLELLSAGKAPTADEFKKLVLAIDSHNVIAKRWAEAL